MIEVPRQTILQILGCLMKDPSLLSQLDKYRLDPNEFSRALDRYIYSTIYNLYSNGAQQIHIIDLDSSIALNPAAKATYDNENGLKFIQDCEEFSELANFDYYYNNFKKINLLRDLNKKGIDISQFYCDNPLDPNYYIINQNFENLSCKNILEALKADIAALENLYTSDTAIEEMNVYQGMEKLIEELKVKPEVGAPMQGDYFNTVSRGARLGKLYLRSASSGVGKAIPNYTKIPTLNGIKQVDEIKVGDYLFDRNGNPTKVLAVYPQAEKKQIYKVYFKSGKVAECCEEHLWTYRCNSSRAISLKTASLKDLIKLEKEKGLQNSKGAYRYSIPVNKPLNFKEKTVPIDPYVLGLILGDGSFCYNDTNKAFMFSSADEELPKEICKRMNYKCYKKSSEHNYNWYFELQEQHSHKNVWVEDILSAYPELWNIKTEFKHIPEDYLYSSVSQRQDILAGLMDTDGSIDEKGRISITTISPFLRDDIIWLCESLGYTTHIILDKREQYSTGICYDIRIQAPKTSKLTMFKLSRKYNIAYNYVFNNKRSENKEWDSIIKIEPTEEYTDMTCFTVDNEECLFLMNNCIVTHNTRTMVGDSCMMAFPIRYDSRQGKWVSTGSCEKVCYIATEQDVAEIQTMILAYLTDINEEAFLYGHFDLVDMQLITKALDIMKKYQNNLWLIRISDPSATVVKNVIRKYHQQKQVDYFYYDYIFSSPAMLNEYRDLKLREDICLRLFTTQLKDLAVELNIFILTSTQVSNDDGKPGFRDYHYVQGSKAIVNLVDLACIMSRPSDEEINKLREENPDLNYRPNIVIDVYKNRRGRWTQIRIWGCNDLGTCRRQEVFVTDIKNMPLENFKLVDFNFNSKIDEEELEEYYNDGVIPTSDNDIDTLVEIVHNSQEAHAEREDDFFISDAFDNKIDKIKRSRKKGFGDYL